MSQTLLHPQAQTSLAHLLAGVCKHGVQGHWLQVRQSRRRECLPGSTLYLRLSRMPQYDGLHCLSPRRVNDLVKLEIKINGELAEPLSLVCHRDAAYRTGRALVSKLKELIPRQMFRVPIQACVGVKVSYSYSLDCLSTERFSITCSLACKRVGRF
jgi:hypothetical protein